MDYWKEKIEGRFSLNSTHPFSVTLSFFPLDCHQQLPLSFLPLDKDEEQEKKYNYDVLGNFCLDGQMEETDEIKLMMVLHTKLNHVSKRIFRNNPQKKMPLTNLFDTRTSLR